MSVNENNTLRDTLDAIPQIIWVCRPDGEIEYFNREALTTFGIGPDEIVPKSWQALVHPDDLQQTIQQWTHVVQTGDTYHIEYRLKMADGVYRWYLARAQPKRNAKGEITHWFGTCTDIDDRKRQEQQKETQYAVTRILAEAQDLTEATPKILQALCTSLGWQLGLIWHVDSSRHCLRCVESWHASHINVEAFIQTNTSTSFAIDVGLPGRVWCCKQPQWVANLIEDPNFPRADLAYKAGLCSALGFPILHAHEVVGVIECFSTQVQPPDQDLLAMMSAIGSQIGLFMERQRTQMALNESQALFESFIYHSPIAAFIKDEMGYYLYAKPLTAQLHKQHLPQSLLGKTDFDLFSSEVAQQLRANDQAVLASNQAIQVAETLRFEDEEYHFLSFKFPFQDTSGRKLVAGVAIDISDRNQMEQALRESEERFRLAARAVVGVVYDWNFVTNQVYRSEGLYELLGIAADQAPSTRDWWIERIHPEDIQDLQAMIQPIQEGHSDRYDAEYRVRHQDGRWIDVWDRGYLLRDSQGTVIRIVGFTSDITQRKQTEAALRSSEERLALAYQAAKIGSFEWNIQTNETIWSQEQEALYGLPPGSFQGGFEHWQQAVHPDDRDRAVQDVLQAVANQTGLTTEFRIVWPDGSIHWIAAKGRVYCDREGNPLRLIGVNEDISERMRIEAERKQAALAQQLLAEASAVLVSSLDTQNTLTNIAQLVIPLLADFCFVDIITSDGKIQRVASHHANPAKQSLYHQVYAYIPSLDMQTHPVTAVLMSGESKLISQVTDEWMQAIASGPEHLQLMREIQLQSLMTVPFIARGRTLGAITLAMTSESDRHYNFADLVLAEELAHRAALAIDNAQLYQQAQEANRIKDEFLTVLSHELRSPLNPIIGWTQLLRTRKFDQQAIDRALATIERNAKLQAQLIEDLLDVSRILRGKMVLNIVPVDPTSIVAAALETVQLAAEAKEIKIQTELQPGIGKISGDANRLQQVVWNLLSNAIKFTPVGGQVKVQVACSKTEAKIQVKDTGKGINPTFLPYVFEYFRQEDGKTTRQFGGLGLGLAIVRYLTELHGGSVRAESDGEGKGATFTVYLPLMRETQTTQPATQAHDAPFPEDPAPLTGVKVLVVDDELDMRELLAVVLEQAGAIVQVATSPSEALTTLAQFRPKVLISDIGMPETDGYTLIQTIRRLPIEQGGLIPAIALTAYAGEAHQQKALARGFQIHLSKPIEPEVLIQSIIQLLR